MDMIATHKLTGAKGLVKVLDSHIVVAYYCDERLNRAPKYLEIPKGIVHQVKIWVAAIKNVELKQVIEVADAN